MLQIFLYTNSDVSWVQCWTGQLFKPFIKLNRFKGIISSRIRRVRHALCNYLGSLGYRTRFDNTENISSLDIFFFFSRHHRVNWFWLICAREREQDSARVVWRRWRWARGRGALSLSLSLICALLNWQDLKTHANDKLSLYDG